MKKQQEYIYYASIGNEVLAIPAKDDDEVNNALTALGLTAKRIWLKDYSE